MTEEEWKAWEIQKALAMKNGEPAAPIASRVEWLEADAAAQRTAILKLERAAKITCKALWASWVFCVFLTVMVLT
jgi:hypothetical protein